MFFCNNLEFSNLEEVVQHIKVARPTKLSMRQRDEGSKLDPEGAKRLAEALQGTEVTEVDIFGHDIGPVGAKNFAEGLRGTKVTVVNISLNNIGPLGAKNFAEGLRGTKVTKVNIAGNDIGDVGAGHFAAGLHGTNVTIVGIAGNDIGAEGAGHFAAGLHGTNVTIVDLSQNGIGDVGAGPFAAGLRGTKVTKVSIWSNGIGPLGAKNFAEGLRGTKVTEVNIAANGIGPLGAKNFAEGLRGTNVTIVHIGSNNIGPEGAGHFAKGLHGTKVTIVTLSRNNIGPEGARPFAEGLHGTNVTIVDLSQNGIGDVGAGPFAEGLHGTKVTQVNIGFNGIGDVGAAHVNSTLGANKHSIRNSLDVANLGQEWSLLLEPDPLKELYEAAPRLIAYASLMRGILSPQNTIADLWCDIFAKKQYFGQPISWRNVSARDVLYLIKDYMEDGPLRAIVNGLISLEGGDIIVDVLSYLAHMKKWEVASDILDRYPDYPVSKLLATEIFVVPGNIDSSYLEFMNKVVPRIVVDEQFTTDMKAGLEGCIQSMNTAVGSMLVARCIKLGTQELAEAAREDFRTFYNDTQAEVEMFGLLGTETPSVDGGG